MSIVRKFECGYRNCKKIIETDNNKRRFCNRKCRDAESRRLKEKPVKPIEIKYEMPKPKENKHFSTKWLEDAWLKVRHEYIKEI